MTTTQSFDVLSLHPPTSVSLTVQQHRRAIHDYILILTFDLRQILNGCKHCPGNTEELCAGTEKVRKAIDEDDMDKYCEEYVTDANGADKKSGTI
ncbi:MAG: hypothetical protein Q9211_001565 [Gyalolechia sp. 1 TL-2023]